jgi:iron(III) transport system ATP-binding protein
VFLLAGVYYPTATPDDIYRLPRSAFVADFIGSANLVHGRNRRDLATDGLLALETPGGQVIYGNAYGRSAGDELTVSVRTVHLQISPQRPAGDRNVWPARVETVFQGDFTQVHILWGDQRLIARCAALDPLPAGQEVFISVDPKRVVLLGT